MYVNSNDVTTIQYSTFPSDPMRKTLGNIPIVYSIHQNNIMFAPIAKNELRQSDPFFFGGSRLQVCVFSDFFFFQCVQWLILHKLLPLRTDIIIYVTLIMHTNVRLMKHNIK